MITVTKLHVETHIVEIYICCWFKGCNHRLPMNGKIKWVLSGSVVFIALFIKLGFCNSPFPLTHLIQR